MSDALIQTVDAGQPTAGQGLTEKLSKLRSAQAGQKQLVLIAILASIVAAVIVVLLWLGSETYQPLYGNQEGYDSAQVLEVLESEGIPYQLAPRSGQVMVPQDRVAQARLLLASRGVKAALPSGLEVLEQAGGLGTSQFIEQARYRHGLEGELALSIMTMEPVRNARVHLAIPKRTSFIQKNQQKPSASVVVELKTGAKLSADQVLAIVNLVAGSVTGLAIEDVSVVDQQGHLLSSGIADEGQQRASVRQLDYARSLEKQLINNASMMLQPIIGNEHFRIQVAASVDFNLVEETQESIAPDAVLRSEFSKTDQSNGNMALGIPGALSNKPPVEQKPGQNEADAVNATSAVREEVSRQFEVGRTVRHTRYQQGQLQRLNVAVVINSDAAPTEAGWTQAQQTQLGQMIKDAIGFDEARGDKFSLQAFPFAPVQVMAPAEELQWWHDPMLQLYLKYVLGSLLGLALIFFALRPLVMHLIRTTTPHEAASNERLLESGKAGATGADNAEQGESTELSPAASSPDKKPAGALAEQPEPEDAIDAILEQYSPMLAPKLPEPDSGLHEQLHHLQRLSKEEPARVAEVVKQWLNAQEKV